MDYPYCRQRVRCMQLQVVAKRQSKLFRLKRTGQERREISMAGCRLTNALRLIWAVLPAALLLGAVPVDAKKGKGKTVEVGPIWNQQDAERKCPKAARRAGGYWTGQWWTTKPGRMSVCQYKVKASGKRMIEVGPIWNQADANVKCPKAARKSGGYWTGQWKTTRPGIMSVCEIRR